MPARLALIIAVLAATAAAALPSAAHALPTRVDVGIGDQKSGMFNDERFADLGIRHARIVVPWDVFRYEWQRAELDDWMRAARRTGTRVLVSWSHSRGKDRRRVLPKPEQFQREFRRFRRTYPWVKEFAIWNEANHCGEPTCNRAKLVAAYYRALRKACGHCDLMPAALLDMPNMVRSHLKVEPKIWALHNYVGVNRRSTASTKALLRAVKGEIWITETGGLVERRQRRKETVDFKEGVRHAATVTRFVLDRVSKLDRRITRMYLYHWDTVSPEDSWDSALIGPNGPREAFLVLMDRLRIQDKARNRAERRRER
jgi:hypothetical protein